VGSGFTTGSFTLEGVGCESGIDGLASGATRLNFGRPCCEPEEGFAEADGFTVAPARPLACIGKKYLP